ncbi:beta-glucoside-specific PTS transporter subunit IIABC [uncultured Agathobaculum sp.]|uniref:beta-glucoside-specific PTS transporter subunit IIABC n=1 Tax=uncultured Agathobaculum sp. TaxID=2048140 RepID=UPI00320BAC12
MGKYSELAKDIVRNVGGKENVAGLVHCITRLRFTLKDEAKANDEVLKAMNGVVTVMKSGGQYQVVIGNHVAEVYDDVCAVLGMKEDSAAPAEVKKGKLLDRAIDIVSGIFQPILGIMAACGMLKGFNTLFATLGWYATTDGIYLIINAAGDALFNFLPLFLGYTAAKKFNLKPMLGLAIGAALCYPAIQSSALSAAGEPLYTLFEGTMFASPVYIDFLGLPVIAVDYTGTVIPVILSVWFASKCEKLFNRIVPELVKFFFVPMLTLLVTLPITLLLLGPVATFGSTLISEFTLTIRSFSPLVAGAVVGLTWQLLAIFGMHWGFIPVYINNVMTLGYDNVMMPFFACTFATSAVVLAIFFKTKNKKLKEMAIPNFISGIFGVTEPAIYGILLPLKKPFIISCIAGGIGGAFYGHFNFRKFILGGMGIFELPNMMNPDRSMGNIIVALVGIAISMAVGFVLTMIFYRDPETNEETPKTVSIETEKAAQAKNIVIASPVKGKVIALSDVQDEAFSAGILGQGAAILPEDDTIYAPADGTIANMFSTGHAIGMLTDSGAEVLIHVGMDTVQLNGKGFEPLVQSGDTVKKGQALLKFDRNLIEAAGYSLVTPVIITNSDAYAAVLAANTETVNAGDSLLTLS